MPTLAAVHSQLVESHFMMIVVQTAFGSNCCDVPAMESTEQQKDEHSSQHLSTSDSGQRLANPSLLSIKTLRPWEIPEHCIVSDVHLLVLLHVFTCD